MRLFWALFTIDVIAALIIIYVFIIGLSDGSVSLRNAGLWLFILLAAMGILGGSYYFFTQGKMGLANTIVCILAVPALLYLLFVVMMVIGGGKWI
ncbi:MAG TPA: hypothetical protein PKD90_15630 [Phnomibacter sp.]|nr:hypothetical protein [Phnomibacter sp.]